MKFRFTADHSDLRLEDGLPYVSQKEFDSREEFPEQYISLDKANALLEAEEAKCERVYKHPGQAFPTDWCTKAKGATHTALLWNVEKIEEEEK